MRTLLFLLLSSLKWGKLATTGGTMLLSLAVYATIWGWRYAAGFVALLLVHEMGHYVAARQCGLDVGAPTFIPFVGAWIALKDQPHDAEVEAYVAMAGSNFVAAIDVQSPQCGDNLHGMSGQAKRSAQIYQRRMPD